MAQTDLLNRHMSIGFTVPFTMVFKGPSPTLADVGLIISGFRGFSIQPGRTMLPIFI